MNDKLPRMLDTDIVNASEFFEGWTDEKSRLFVLSDHGYVIAAAIASNLQDALDEIVDESDKLDRFMVGPEEMNDYPDEEGLTHLGNACEPFDIESLDVSDYSLPERSLMALYRCTTNLFGWR